ncbi:MAG: hypothetical protein LBH06_02025 [Rikenellaceae bacterium]|nr:hypothetical protein [Rikenellaceae bacterium]
MPLQRLRSPRRAAPPPDRGRPAPKWYELWTLNRLPHRWRAPLLGLYNRAAWIAAWILAGKGF